ncbi:hypothetical protein BC829DRAFT_494515 [Chytridium lagenaria]|nr:hypothetical protein BC829DRAFT_494515 [Chytridium lagenaria]
MNQVFSLGTSLHGQPPSNNAHTSRPGILLKWQPIPCSYLASVGSNHIINISDRHGLKSML